MFTLGGPAPVDMTAILSDANPLAEAGAAAPGTAPKATRQGHVHPRLTSAGAQTPQVLDANGEFAITFTRTFPDPANPPTVIYSEINPTPANTTTFVTKSYTVAGGIITGCTVYGRRRKNAPTITAISTGIVLLLNLINGINAVLAQLSNAPVEEASAGTRFSYVALMSSQV